jgi:hypothetical protein
MLRHALGAASFCLSLLIPPGLRSAWGQDAVPATAPAPPPPVALFDFESDALLPLWAAADPAATLAITADPVNVAEGKGALEFTYEARPGVFQQISTGALGAASANCLTMRLKATSPTSLSVGVAEQNGARYQGLLWIDADEWTDVSVPLGDLILAQDAQDDDAQLDPDEVSGFFLADLANLPGEVGQALGRKEGAQRIWLDSVGLTTTPQPRSRARVEPQEGGRLVVLDDFESPVLWGLPVRRAGLQRVPGAPKAAGQRALEISYTLGAGRWVGYVLAPPGQLDLSGATQLSLWAKTDLNARLVFALEERDGTKYDTAVKVPPDGKWHPVLAPFEAFAPFDPAADENGVLDAQQIHRAIILIDTFDADVRPGGLGSVAIDDLGLIVPAAPPQGQP